MLGALAIPASSQRATRPLASGAYHEHDALQAGERSWILRRCVDSQWGLQPREQLQREYATLLALAATGVAPAPHALVVAPGGPILVEELVVGAPFAYAADLPALGAALAQVHALAPAHLPAVDARIELLSDGDAWLRRADSAGEDPKAVTALLGLRDRGGGCDAGVRTLVHTDLNAGNLLVEGGRCRLLDWEAARLADPAWDLAHALSPTTTQWDAGAACIATPGQVRDMLSAYRGACADRAMADATVRRLPGLLDAVMFRAMAWVLGFAAQARDERRDLGEDLADALARYRDPAFVSRILSACELLELE